MDVFPADNTAVRPQPTVTCRMDGAWFLGPGPLSLPSEIADRQELLCGRSRAHVAGSNNEAAFAGRMRR